jgi:hypothetical protein
LIAVLVSSAVVRAEGVTVASEGQTPIVAPNPKERWARYPTDRSPGLTPAIQGGANIGLIFYP